jgi:hypothetical protein
MEDKWMIRGKSYANCNCAYGCPCQFNAKSTNGHCEAIANIMIEEGNFNDVKLDGLCFTLLVQWPGEIADGNGKEQVIIHESATPEQREALEKIALGKSTKPGGTVFYIYNSTMSEVLDTLYAPIEMAIDVDARRGSVQIDGLAESAGVPLIDPFSNQETRKQIRLPEGFEYVVAEMGSGTSKVTAGIKLDLNDSYGQFNLFHINQDGVIRDSKYLAD